MANVCVFGIGSHHGDDQAGWHVADRLRQRTSPDVLVRAVSSPDQILDHLDGCRKLIVIDSCQSGQPPGTIIRLQWPDARFADTRANSTHGLQLDALLRIAESLGNLPPAVVFFGIEVAPDLSGFGLSPVVRHSLVEFERRVLDELAVDVA